MMEKKKKVKKKILMCHWLEEQFLSSFLLASDKDL